MRKKIALFMTMVMVMVSVCGLATVSAFAVPQASAEIEWDDNSNAAGKRPATVVVIDDLNNEYTLNALDGDSQYVICAVGTRSVTYPDIDNYTKTLANRTSGDMEEFCTYTYTGGSSTVMDVTVPEVIAFVADENGDFSSDVNIKNNSTMSIETVLSAEAYGNWSIVPSSTSFDSMGANQNKFSLIAEEPGLSEIDLSAGAYTFSISSLGSADFVLKGKTGPVTENINEERCVTVGLYITESL